MHKRNDLTMCDRRFLSEQRQSVRVSMASLFDEMFGKNTRLTAGARIVIHGKNYMDMYDHAAGFAFFTQDSDRTVEAMPYTTLSAIRVQAEGVFQSLSRPLSEALEADTVYEGFFSPNTVRIIDGRGRTLDIYERGKWLDGHIGAQQWDDTRRSVQELRTLASRERCWDNFSTAQALEDQASRLEWKLEAARSAVENIPF
ncbi:hypothetical protein DFO67_12445 [Modicisalibacter xianhensis]|uniref:Uncharacterized protein n=1 Tax=Modicisalibacter xianhensis TaxID=442341 RepID=A0A4R8FIM7_9GAMM|nr:hypothetical protein [Halomonas xianhensis]TDX23728.1 hypothetical protein DFO67_12445 [Halomonas xianhensis]